jgi:tetratricopeptide (TPR) repeat protein
VLERQGKLDEAAACYRKAIDLDPKDANALSSLGWLLQRQGKRDEAAALHRKALEIDPNTRGLQRRGEAVAGGRVSAQEVAAVPQTPASDVQSPRNSQEAAPLVSKPVEKKLNDADVRNHRAAMLERQGNWEAAAALYRNVLDANPMDAAARNRLAELLARQGKPDEAAALYDKFTSDKSTALNNLGWVLDRDGKPDAAAALYRKALESDPKNSKAFANLCNVLVRQGKSGEAAALCRKAIEADPQNPDAYFNFAVGLSFEGRLGDAAALYRKAIEVDPKNVGARANLADALIRQGKAEEAETHCRRALELHPRDRVALTNLAEAALALGNYVEARQAARQALSVTPSNSPDRAETEQALRQAGVGERLAAVLRGDDHPNSGAEDVDFAGLCRYQWRLADAVRLFTSAFAADPGLAADLAAGHRYHAACAAALAACGTGKGAPGPDDPERARLHRAAREWLRADLALRVRQLASGPAEKAEAATQLRHWLSNDDLARVRDSTGPTQPRESERKEWEAFWAEVKAVLANPPAK